MKQWYMKATGVFRSLSQTDIEILICWNKLTLSLWEYRAIFNWVSKVISELLWFRIYFTQWLVQSSRAIFSTNQKWNQNQSWLARAHFPALCVGYVQLLRVLIGLLDCLRPFDWPKLLLWFWFYDSRLKLALYAGPNQKTTSLFFYFLTLL